MSDKKIKVQKPERVKPAPVKPMPTKPISVKPVKAESAGHCVRCSCELDESSGVVRAVCSSCDLELQGMHWKAEYSIYGKTMYISDRAAQKAASDGHSVYKAPPPKRRDFFRPPVNEALVL